MATATITTTLHPTPTQSHHIRLSPAPSRKRNHQNAAPPITNVTTQNDIDGPRQPKLRITASQKQALIENLQLEITERARNLRAQYSLQATDLRSRIERRINRIPVALRKVKMGELMAKHEEQKNRQSSEAAADTTTESAAEETTAPSAPAPAAAPAAGAGTVRKVSKRHLSPEKDVLGPNHGGHHQSGANGANPSRVVKKKKANNPSANVLPSPSQTQSQSQSDAQQQEQEQAHHITTTPSPADDKENEPYLEPNIGVNVIKLQPRPIGDATSPLKNTKRRNSPTHLPLPHSPTRRLHDAAAREREREREREENEARVLTPKSPNHLISGRASPLKQIELVISPTKKNIRTPAPLHSATLPLRGAMNNSNHKGMMNNHTFTRMTRPATVMGFHRSGSPTLKNGAIYTDRESDDDISRPTSSSTQKSTSTARFGRPRAQTNAASTMTTPLAGSKIGSAVKNSAAMYGHSRHNTVASATPSRTAKTVGYSGFTSATKHKRPGLPKMGSNDSLASQHGGTRSGITGSGRDKAQTGMGIGTVRKNGTVTRPTTALGTYSSSIPGSTRKVVRKKAAA